MKISIKTMIAKNINHKKTFIIKIKHVVYCIADIIQTKKMKNNNKMIILQISLKRSQKN